MMRPIFDGKVTAMRLSGVALWFRKSSKGTGESPLEGVLQASLGKHIGWAEFSLGLPARLTHRIASASYPITDGPVA